MNARAPSQPMDPALFRATMAALSPNDPKQSVGRLVRDLPFADYLAVDALSASGMRLLSRSAWHYRHRIQTVPTRPMLRGTLAHAAVLEPHALIERYVVVPEDAPRRPSKAQWAAKKPSPESQASMDWWTGFQQQAASREIVPAADYAITQQQLAALKAEPMIAELLSKGYGECSVFWTDADTGVPCKARPDWVHPINERQVKLLDLKTTADESPNAFGRAAASFGMHRQAAHYVSGFEAATGLEVVEFVFAAVTSAPPVKAEPYVLTDEIAAQGFEEVRECLERYAWCVENDQWPSYEGPRPLRLDFPAYAKRNLEIEVSYVE